MRRSELTYFLRKNSCNASTKLITAVTVRIVSIMGLINSYVCNKTKTIPKNVPTRTINNLSISGIVNGVKMDFSIFGYLFLFLQSYPLICFQYFFSLWKKLHTKNKLQSLQKQISYKFPYFSSSIMYTFQFKKSRFIFQANPQGANP